MKRILLITAMLVIAASAFYVLYGDRERKLEERVLRQADAEFPTAGACGDAVDGVGIFEIHPDIPGPRCIKFLTGEKIGFKNSTENQISFSFAGEDFNLAPGETKIIGKTAGEFLDFGVHKVPMDVYSGSGPEIWVVRNRETVNKEGYIQSLDLQRKELRLDGEVFPLGSIAMVKLKSGEVIEITDFQPKDSKYKIVIENGIVIVIEEIS